MMRIDGNGDGDEGILEEFAMAVHIFFSSRQGRYFPPSWDLIVTPAQKHNISGCV
jgi:hypothetical protein